MYGGGPEYDDPANCAPEDDQYGSQYGGNYGAPYDHYGSRGSVGRRSVGECSKLKCLKLIFPFNLTKCWKLFAIASGSTRNLPVNGSPEPPLPPPRNHDSLNDSKESNDISEAECDRDHPRGNYGGKTVSVR